MPGRCALCAGEHGVRDGAGWTCTVCGWRYGDVPDADLPPPRIDVVYYIRYADRVKIGTSSRPRQRLAALWHEELLAFEPGDRVVERRRHAQFASLREGGEWFRADPVLLAHVAAVADGAEPWHAYARWVADAYRARL